MNDFLTNDVYREVDETLKLKKKLRDKIPISLLQMIESHAKQSNKPFQYNPEKGDVFMQISNEALSLYTSLFLDYCATEKEKEEIKKVIIENEVHYKSSQK